MKTLKQWSDARTVPFYFHDGAIEILYGWMAEGLAAMANADGCEVIVTKDTDEQTGETYWSVRDVFLEAIAVYQGDDSNGF